VEVHNCNYAEILVSASKEMIVINTSTLKRPDRV
jgi:hypothetical protein